MLKSNILAVTFLFSMMAAAQTAQPLLQPHQTFFNMAGNPCAGCSLYSYAAGTTTALATYTDASEATPNTNPVVLDAAGGANVWMGANAYKFALLDTSGTTLWTVDNIVAPFPGGQGPFLPLSGGTLTGPISGPALEATGRSVVFPTQGLSFQWNLTDTAGEGDFVNYMGLGPGGFSWYNTAAGSAVGSPIMNLSSGGILNTIGGFQYYGLGLLNHVLLGNGTAYVDAAAIPASIVSGLYYQTVDANGSPTTQEPVLSFNDTLAVGTDTGQTNVGLANVGTAGSCTYCSATFDAYGRATSYSSGTGSTFTGTSGYQIGPSGLIEEWVEGPVESANFSGPVTVTLPYTFPNQCFTKSAQLSTLVSSTPTGNGNSYTNYVQSCTTTSVTVWMDVGPDSVGTVSHAVLISIKGY